MSESDFEDDRPSKRRRRDSRSISPRRERGDETSRGKRSEHANSKYERRDDKSSATSMKDRPHRPSRSSRSPGRHGSSHRRRTSTNRDKRDRRNNRDRSRSRSTSRRREVKRHRERRHNSKDRNGSPRRERDRDRPRHNRNHSPPPPQSHHRSSAPLPSQNDAFTSKSTTTDSSLTPLAPKQKPNFKPTGKLAAASNTIQTANQTIVLKYHEPSEARKPPVSQPWRLYVFKDDAILDTVELASQSCWLFGRETAVVEIPTEHPSCSKQHAVIQFRYMERRNEFGDRVGGVKPYVLDLESANGTRVNGEVVPQAKYVELKDKDVVTFGESTREYVLQLPP